jgi:hypothetical protein
MTASLFEFLSSILGTDSPAFSPPQIAVLSENVRPFPPSAATLALDRDSLFSAALPLKGRPLLSFKIDENKPDRAFSRDLM